MFECSNTRENGMSHSGTANLMDYQLKFDMNSGRYCRYCIIVLLFKAKGQVLAMQGCISILSRVLSL